MSTPLAEDSWPAVLATLIARQHLPRGQAEWAMSEVMSGSASDAQIAAFVVGLRAKGEDPDEVVGLVEGMLAHSVGIEVTGPSLDVVGTGGDHANLVNISTMSAIVAAAAGARVVKHGNRAASSACWSNLLPSPREWARLSTTIHHRSQVRSVIGAGAK